MNKHYEQALCLGLFFCLNNPDKIVVATGDTRQLKNPESVSYVFEFEAYANRCIDLMLKNNIMLYEY